MLIQCPECGRSGNLPNEQVFSAHILRCRKCQSRFVIGAVPLEEPEPALVRVHLAQEAAPNRGGFHDPIGDDFFSGEDEELGHGSSYRPPSPADSHYALPEPLDDDDDELNDWTPDEFSTSSIDRDRGVGDVPSGSEPWYFEFIQSWGRAQFVGVIGFAGLSVMILGGLVVAWITGNLRPESPAIGLAVSVVAAIALLMISLSTTALNLLLLDLLRNVHRLQSNPESQPRPRR